MKIEESVTSRGRKFKRQVDFDVAIIGGGHAGVEAAVATDRMGRTACIITIDTAKLALMSCNPAIGGIAKSHVVKEIDVLGGLMAEAIDATGIQFRRLNLSRGPAVWSTRAQADRAAYSEYVALSISCRRNVTVVEGLASQLVTKNGAVAGVLLKNGEMITCRAAILATGTFLGGLIHIGEKKIPSGRMGEPAAYELSRSLRKLGFEVARLKTGTPPRLDGNTIDWSRCLKQPGEEPIPFFSHRTRRHLAQQVPCFLTHTTEETRSIITASLDRSPIFSGQIRSAGPRYCPSIEDKFHRFAKKPTHPIFLEPEGNGTNEIYPNGFSTALPEDIQIRAIRTVHGLEQATITRPGYAIEYDYCPAYQIKKSLETKRVRGLFLAGQINGTSGYEEAAGQGLMAGINAVLMIERSPAFTLDRSVAYLGVMIDDLTTRSTTEPYRLFTSRAEYRLALREDNARDRLIEYAKRYGLLPDDEVESFEQLRRQTEREISLLRKERIKTSQLGALADRFKRRDSLSLEQLIKQPGVTLKELMPILARFDGTFSKDRQVLERAAIRIRYKGYIDKQNREIEKSKRLEAEAIPGDFPFERVKGVKQEAYDKFLKYRPDSIGQAGRIEGVTPGDVAVLSVFVRKHKGTPQ